MASLFAFTALALFRSALAAYSLSESYDVSNFFTTGFSLDDSPELNGGFATYVDYNTATGSGMVSTTSNSVKLGMEHNTKVSSNGPGRQSIRAVSKNRYNSGLFVFDILHNPGGICGSFPALWTVGPDCPNNGEVNHLRFLAGIHHELILA